MQVSRLRPEDLKASTDTQGHRLTDWSPIAALPNIRLRGAIDGTQIALIGWDDLRMLTLFEASRPLRSFLTRFTDSHGEKLKPALMVIDSSLPLSQRLTSEAVSAFKEIVTASFVLHHRIRTTKWARNSGPNYSNSFSLYPWMLGRDNERLYATSPAITAIHEINKFRGMSSPDIPVHDIAIVDSDHILFDQLMSVWRSRYLDGDDSWRTRATLRSLNMASAAMQLPGGTDATFFDFGRTLSLWVSAFEILIHPGSRSGVNRDRVCALLKQIDWRNRSLVSGSMPATALYSKLNRLRNDFLHGNPVERADLDLASGRSVLDFAAPLYRMALQAHLGPVEFEQPSDNAPVQDCVVIHMRNNNRRRFLYECEECLLLASQPPRR